MQILDTVTYEARGPRREMLDLSSHDISGDRYEYLTVVDGSGRDGLVIAELTRHAITEAATDEGTQAKDAPNRATILGQRLLGVTATIPQYLSGGAAFTTIVVPPDNLTQLGIAHLGDVEAFYVPDDESEMMSLITPHTYDSLAEGLIPKVHEPQAGTYDTVERSNRIYFRDPADPDSQPTQLFGAVGYSNVRYMVHNPMVSSFVPRQPGRLAIGSDGFWGRRSYDEIRELIADGPTQELVDGSAEMHRDNAKLILATVALAG